MPRTVLSIVSTLARRGPMNVLMSLIRHLDPLQYRAVIATLSPEPADSLIDEFRSLGVPVRQMKLSRAGAFLSGARGLRRLVSDVQPDLIHTHGLRADVLAAKAGLECPIVSTLHCDLPEDYGFAYGRRLGALVAIRHFAALKRFNHVIAVSESVADTALRWGIATDSIPNGVDLGEYCPPRDLNQMRALRAHFGWPSEAVIVLHTGSLSRRKNPVDVVSGFSASSYPGAACWFSPVVGRSEPSVSKRQAPQPISPSLASEKIFASCYRQPTSSSRLPVRKDSRWRCLRAARVEFEYWQRIFLRTGAFSRAFRIRCKSLAMEIRMLSVQLWTAFQMSAGNKDSFRRRPRWRRFPAAGCRVNTRNSIPAFCNPQVMQSQAQERWCHANEAIGVDVGLPQGIFS